MHFEAFFANQIQFGTLPVILTPVSGCSEYRRTAPSSNLYTPLSIPENPLSPKTDPPSVWPVHQSCPAPPNRTKLNKMRDPLGVDADLNPDAMAYIGPSLLILMTLPYFFSHNEFGTRGDKRRIIIVGSDFDAIHDQRSGSLPKFDARKTFASATTQTLYHDPTEFLHNREHPTPPPWKGIRSSGNREACTTRPE